ncbi:beta-ketoacyl-[acyl-carrier-protein] synthase family protein [Streptomyces griseocarneus]|uniref:beta-ketoacyl-[acyl-carrier-protein] synthase family protein n=1 Tax=Streptomyces griseocarneus TaxID=51201 RepID=UPI00167F036F|nr:beta-ketoacyl-[acyl-carrier-protein] synthase family protein [Streptomyces griseocarneus]MBZ6476173.1 beta-ketoacyl-[acyl-carrier-protein] synthase family protein [Streptomyces griseocarneus]GHG63587.1 beta-ACP synthase [Streptomyces griseocarneus]
MTPVLITGAGAVSCLGVGVPAMWKALCAAPEIRPRPAADPGARMRLPLIHPAPAEPGTDGRATRLALTAAREAIVDAGLTSSECARAPVVLGTGGGNADHWERPLAAARPAPPGFTVAAALATAIGSGAGATCVSNACAAGGFALAIAADLIRTGEAEVVVAGGAEAYSRVALACFNRMGAVDARACRPFHRDRAGTVFGEGAAVFVLETADHARRRGVRHAYARLAGSGWSCDAHHLTAPEPAGSQIRRAMTDALDEAGATTGTVGCVVPHGTGTRLNDVVESQALGAVFGDHAAHLPVYSLKALIGHTAGAAGALGALAAALMLDHGTVPPNAPLGPEQDPHCPVNLPQGPSQPLTGRHILVNAFAFGGNNVSLVLEGSAA